MSYTAKYPFLTGNKQRDLMVLSSIDDMDLTSMCQVNKEINALCQDDMLWSMKLTNKYPRAVYMKPKDMSHRDAYVLLSTIMSRIDENSYAVNIDKLHRLLEVIAANVIVKIPDEHLPHYHRPTAFNPQPLMINDFAFKDASGGNQERWMEYLIDMSFDKNIDGHGYLEITVTDPSKAKFLFDFVLPELKYIINGYIMDISLADIRAVTA